MKFKTVTGSLYEVNSDSRQIRRLNGAKDPQPRQGKDGEWKSYLGNLSVKVGEPVWITWADVHPVTDETKEMYESLGIEPPPPAPGRPTITSPVVEIEP